MTGSKYEFGILGPLAVRLGGQERDLAGPRIRGGAAAHHHGAGRRRQDAARDRGGPDRRGRFVTLAATGDAELVPAAVCDALAVPRIPDEPPQAALTRTFADRRL